MKNTSKMLGISVFAAVLLFAGHTAGAKTLTVINPSSRVYAYHGVVTAVPNVPVVMPGMVYYPPVNTPGVSIYSWPPEDVQHYYVPPSGNVWVAEHGNVTVLPPSDRVVIDARNP